MHPLLITVTALAAWLIAILIGWAFVHGAQILRRQEVAGLIADAQERAAMDTPATVTPIAPEPVRLPEAA